VTKYVLKYPVHTVDNTTLLPAGTELTPDVLKEVRMSGLNKRFPSVKLSEFGTMKKDIQDLMLNPPYDFIFSQRERTETVIAAMSKIRIIEPVLESLEYFKNNDFYTYRHILMVFASSILLGRELMKDHVDLMDGAMASPAHDFGKICIPLDILKKSKLLTRAERKIIEHHTLAGYVLLQYYMGASNELISFVARDHHERRNGMGYPCGINLENPLIEIVVVTDIYDALISPRPYRPSSYDNRSALEEISAKAEHGELSLDVVKALVACNRKVKQHYSQCEVSTEKRGKSPAGNTYGLFEKDES
jgi:HD-GYP domain-containing protein (c-di-GMP phosphodiesterase class II)